MTPRQIDTVRGTWAEIERHGTLHLVLRFHAALADLSRARDPSRRRAIEAQGRRLLELLPLAVSNCDASPERLTSVVAAALDRMAREEATACGDDDLVRTALLRALARLDGARQSAEARAAWQALCAALTAAVASARAGADAATMRAA